VAIIIYYAPQAIRIRVAYFALFNEGFPSSGELAYSIYVGNATSVFLLIKFISFVHSIFYK
jgi:hypothetical protein